MNGKSLLFVTYDGRLLEIDAPKQKPQCFAKHSMALVAAPDFLFVAGVLIPVLGVLR
jgi:hypothetical protein